jgi:5'-3' exonuclease
MWRGYKTGAGVDPLLLAQFGPLEVTLYAAGITVWPMVEYEADDALASAAEKAAADRRVERVIICTPDKDLAQSVRGDRIVQLNRRTGDVRTEPDVVRKFGVGPGSIPDWLALVGDSSDGYPGLPGWGQKSASEVLARFKRLEDIPRDYREWHANVRNAGALARVLDEQRDLALLFRDLATLRTDVPVFGSVDELRWTGPRPEFAAMAARMESAT